MQNKFLTKEIIRHMLACFGVVPPLGQAGITTENLLTKKVVRIKYENDEEILHSVYAGQMVLENSRLRGLVVDLTVDDECPEYCLVFRMDSFPLHGLRVSYDDEDFGVFRILNDKETWTEASIFVQGMALSGIERIVSNGFLWEPCDQFNDLYRAAIILADS